MRFSSGFSNFLCLAALLVLPSCASTPRRAAEPEHGVFDGEVEITGSGPIDRTIRLITDDDVSWTLESLSLEGELLTLGGHRIRVWGSVDDDAGIPLALAVKRYEMLPIDDMSPLIGSIGLDGATVIFSTDSEDSYTLAGPLHDALRNFSGCRAWVWGMVADDREGGGGAIIDVRGYGILGPASGATGFAPPDTLRN